MKPDEVSNALEGLYWLSTFPAKLLQLFFAFLGFLLLFPVQVVTWLRSAHGFSETLPYHFLMVLVAFGDDISERPAPTLPRGYRAFLREFELMHSWYLNHARFVRIFLLGRDYQQHEDGSVTVHAQPTADTAARLRRLLLGTGLVALSVGPLVALAILVWLKTGASA
jgi:hypothetical protein